MSFTIRNQDCLEFIEELKKEEKKEIFDAVITDPPYNISKENNFKTIGRSGIDFGVWDYGFDQENWIEKITPLVKKGGTIIIFNDYKNFGKICNKLEECGFEIKDLLRWVKNNPMPRNVNRRYVVDYEFAIWAVKKGAKWTFNKTKDVPYLRPEFRYPIVSGSKNKIHPTQKSDLLMEDIIKIHTNVGDLVFDPFMGSGSTGVACLKTDRIFLGSEKSKIYFSKANDRLNQVNFEKIKNKKVIRSPLYYLGDKYKLLPQIIDKFPKEISFFYDVFGGGGTMLANISAEKIFYNDINFKLTSIIKEIYSFSFKKIIEEINQIIKKWSLIPGGNINKEINEVNKKNFNKFREYYNSFQDKNSHEAIMCLFVLIIFSFNSQIRFNSKQEFNIPFGKQGLNDKRFLNLKSFHSSISLKKIEFFSKDFSEMFEKIIDRKNNNDFVYLDPPYSITTATYNADWGFEEDKKLFYFLDILSEYNIKWAMSNVLESNGKINILLKEWINKNNYIVDYLDFSYKNSNYKRKRIGVDREILVRNYVI